MIKPFSFLSLKTTAAIGLSGGLLGTFLISEIYSPKQTFAQSNLEFRWDNTDRYRKLYYTQSSKEKRDRSTYYLVVRKRDRNTAMLKLSLKFPDYFDSSIKPKKLKLCKVTLGGMLSRTKCIQKIPAIFEVSKDQSVVEIFPEQPIPSEDSYAVVMKIFNPTGSGMYQINATAQSPGDVPISSYIGSWNIDIE